MALVALALSSELIQVDGIARRYLLAEPSGPPSVVVLSLHGSRSGPERQARLSRMAALSQEGAVVAFPQGSLRSGSGYEWDLEGDERFLRATVAALFDRYPAAHHRICMAGMSGGARMSSRLAARNPDTVMLLGPVAGLRARRAPRSNDPCVSWRSTEPLIASIPSTGAPRTVGTRACSTPPRPGPRRTATRRSHSGSRSHRG